MTDRPSAEALLRIVHRVAERPQGELALEIAQAGMTLGALAARLGIDLNDAVNGEFDRVRSIPKEEWARRHAAKAVIGTPEAEGRS